MKPIEELLKILKMLYEDKDMQAIVLQGYIAKYGLLTEAEGERVREILKGCGGDE